MPKWMLERMRYKNHRNEIFDFGKDGIYVNQNDLHDYEWTPTERNNRISGFERKTETRTLPVVILCDTEEKGISARNKLFEVVEQDVLAAKHGKIVIGDYHFKCFVTGSKKRNYLFSKRHLLVDLTLTTDFPYWVKETTIPLEGGFESEEEPVEFEKTTATGTEIATVGAIEAPVQSVRIQGATSTTTADGVKQFSGVGEYDKCVVLDGSETWTAGTITSGEARRYVWGYTDAQPVGSTSEVGIAASDRYKAVTGADLNTGNVAGLAVTTGGKIQFADPAITSLTDWKAYLAEQAAAGTPVTVWYKKATHTEGDPYYTGVTVANADGYHGYAIPLTAPLYSGDMVVLDRPTSLWKESRVRIPFVLDGTEDWRLVNSGQFQVQLDNTDAEGNLRIIPTLQSTWCSHYNYGPSGFTIESGTCLLTVYDSNYTDVHAFMDYLAEQAAAGTPLTVIPQVAKAEIHTAPATELLFTVGENVISAGGAKLTVMYLSGEIEHYDYPFDYAAPKLAETLLNTNFVASDFRMIIHGPVTDPAVDIGGHLYQVYGNVNADEYLTIDTVAKTILLTRPDGTTVNRFADRNRDAYIFQRIPAGANSILWITPMKLDVILLEERSEPKWT